jgi:hypothetical protein
VEIAAQRILRALSPKLLRQNPEGALGIVEGILQDEFGPIKVEL